MRLIYIYIRETIRAITSKYWSFFGSVLTVFLAALLAGSFALIIKNTGLAVEKLKAQASIEVYLKADIDSLTQDYLQGKLVANKAILGFKYISKDMALIRLKDTFGADMLSGIVGNPLPASYELTLEPLVYDGNFYQRLVDSLKVLPGVDDVGYVPQAVSKLKSVFTIVTVLGFLIGILVILACGFIIGNTIGVSVANRHLTFYVMRLVGAANSFVRFPYLFMGLLIGLIGTVLSILVLQIGANSFSGSIIPVVFLNSNEIWSFIIAGGVIGLMGSHLALQRYVDL
jgi:cell division transport system permease protein